jgi:hypothetical protein
MRFNNLKNKLTTEQAKKLVQEFHANNIKELKTFISSAIKEKIKNDDVPAVSFRVEEFGEELQYGGQIGHIQYNTTMGRASYDVFYNGKCVYTSYTLISAVLKLDRLAITLTDFKNKNI